MQWKRRGPPSLLPVPPSGRAPDWGRCCERRDDDTWQSSAAALVGPLLLCLALFALLLAPCATRPPKSPSWDPLEEHLSPSQRRFSSLSFPVDPRPVCRVRRGVEHRLCADPDIATNLLGATAPRKATDSLTRFWCASARVRRACVDGRSLLPAPDPSPPSSAPPAPSAARRPRRAVCPVHQKRPAVACWLGHHLYGSSISILRTALCHVYV